jgi:hypothetical protein
MRPAELSAQADSQTTPATRTEEMASKLKLIGRRHLGDSWAGAEGFMGGFSQRREIGFVQEMSRIRRAFHQA